MKHPYVGRILEKRIKKLFQNFSCVVLTGARQVGKSTLLQHTFPDLACIVFDPVHDVQNARSDPELFLNNHPPPIILDEIQYAPELVPVIKRRIDKTKNPGQYILTGSQQWGMINKIAESLAGRAILTHLEGFSLEEIAKESIENIWLEEWLSDPNVFLQKKTFSRFVLPHTLYEILWKGFMPEVQFIDLEFVRDYHYSYQSTYIEKDIRLLTELHDLQQFSRFVKLVAALIAQEVNYSLLGREIGITPQTAKRWLDLLVGTFEWFSIPAFSNNSIKKISLKPKGYFSDTGQVCFSQMISSREAIGSHPLRGALFENAVVSEIRKLCFYMANPPKLYHWRSHLGSECDLILERDGKLFPIEIKLTSHPNKKDLRGIQAFRKSYPHLHIEKGLVIAPIEEPFLLSENDLALPWDICFKK